MNRTPGPPPVPNALKTSSNPPAQGGAVLSTTDTVAVAGDATLLRRFRPADIVRFAVHLPAFGKLFLRLLAE